MAHYEMYVCLPKTAWEENVPVKIKDKLKLIESVDEDTGEITYKSSITWNEAVFSGKLGAPRWSKNNDYCIVKGEFSMLKGELTSLQALGTDELYPKFSVLTKTEAQELANSEIFTGE
tara:strand:+ start:2781 stop:3134 length:354 start_codon:yes stop_codon:yes gene_type:complete